MPTEKRNYEVEVQSIKKGERDNLSVTLESKEMGMYSFEISLNYYSLFIPGKKYVGVFEISGIPDFIGEEDKMENICTISYGLEKLLENKKVIWEKEKPNLLQFK